MKTALLIANGVLLVVLLALVVFGVQLLHDGYRSQHLILEKGAWDCTSWDTKPPGLYGPRPQCTAYRWRKD